MIFEIEEREGYTTKISIYKLKDKEGNKKIVRMEKNMNKLKKIIAGCTILFIMGQCQTTNVPADISKVTYNEMVNELVNAGYYIDTAKALKEEEMKYILECIKNGSKIVVSSCATEVDNLSQIENFLSANEEELINMGMDEIEIEETQESLDELFKLSNKQLTKKYGLNQTEIKMLRKTKENAQESSKSDNKEIRNEVTASGSISSSKLTYTQTVVNNSAKKKPNYRVCLSYSWKKAYNWACFDDEIVVGWGGGLNCKDYSGKASYYTWNKTSMDWTGRGAFMNKSMSTEVTPNAGIEFIFPQQVYSNAGTPRNGKTKSGSVSLTVYQKKKKGYDTTLISHYCHRVVRVGGAEIGISADGGPSVSISIGAAWDRTQQRKNIITY